MPYTKKAALLSMTRSAAFSSMQLYRFVYVEYTMFGW